MPTKDERFAFFILNDIWLLIGILVLNVFYCSH